MFDFFKKISANATISSLNSQINKLYAQKDKLKSQIENKKKELEEIQREININTNVLELNELGLDYNMPSRPSDEIKEELEYIKSCMADMIDRKQVIQITGKWTVNGSLSAGRKTQEAYSQALLTGFNAYYEKKKKSITVANYDKTCELVRKSFDRFNAKANKIDISFNSEYLDYCLQVMKLYLDVKIATQEEKEKQREEKRILKEQEIFLKEVEKEKKRLAKERLIYKQNLLKALTEQQKEEFREKLKEIDRREENLNYRVQNKRAGYLYIAHTEAMPNYYKIGITQRVFPLERLRELSNASTPFPFKCYGLVFSDDVFTLEKQIHDYFNDKRVNKENRRKEFFNVSPQEIINTLKNKFKCQVYFTSEEDNDESYYY